MGQPPFPCGSKAIPALVSQFPFGHLTSTTGSQVLPPLTSRLAGARAGRAQAGMAFGRGAQAGIPAIPAGNRQEEDTMGSLHKRP